MKVDGIIIDSIKTIPNNLFVNSKIFHLLSYNNKWFIDPNLL